MPELLSDPSDVYTYQPYMMARSMRDPRQGDLFEWAPPTAKVIAFPAHRWAPAIWRGKVERTASVLARKPTEKAKTRYWEDTAATLAEQLRRRGANELEIREQCWQFFYAVQSANQRSGETA